MIANTATLGSVAVYRLVVAADGRARCVIVSRQGPSLWELPQDAQEEDAFVLLDRVHRDDQGPLIAAFHESARRLAPVVARFRVSLPSGGERTCLTQALPERVDGAVCWSGCTVDVTGTGVPSSPASCVPEHAQHAAACEAFSCFVAHDLRAPVHRIRGFAQALIEAGEQDHRGRVTRLARRIAANAAGMEQLVDALLAFTRGGPTR